MCKLTPFPDLLCLLRVKAEELVHKSENMMGSCFSYLSFILKAIVKALLTFYVLCNLEGGLIFQFECIYSFSKVTLINSTRGQHPQTQSLLQGF